MKLMPLILALLCITQLSTAQTFNSGGAATSNYYEEIPYREINGKIIIEVTIAGARHQFLVDTGAPYIISAEIAARLKDTTGVAAPIGDAYGHVDTGQIVTVSKIKLGNTAFVNVPALIGVPAIIKCLGVDGIVGSNLLRGSVVQFIGSKKLMIVTDDTSRLHLDSKFSLPMDINLDRQSSPIITTLVGKIKTQLLFDTGEKDMMEISDNYMSIFKKYNAYTLEASGFGANSYGANGAENNEEKYRIKLASLQVGMANFKNINIITAHNNNGNGNRMGTTLFNYGTVTIDYLHNIFYFEPISLQNDLTETNWPISPMFINGKLVVGIVWEKMKRAVKPGVAIIAVDDMLCDTLDLCYLITQKPLLDNKQHAVLTLKDAQGVVSKIEIVKD